MTDIRHPAGYICLGRASCADTLILQKNAIAEAARQRGWPAPVVYADTDGPALADEHGPELAILIGAIKAGRHDALLVAGVGAISGGPASLMTRLLFPCTHHGIAVEFLTPAGAPLGPALPAHGASEQPPPFPVPRETWSVLARASLEALAGLFPDWRIWLDQHGWHARRRSNMYMQGYAHGAPAFCVHAESSIDLTAQLCFQQAADQHAPSGCSARQLRHRASAAPENFAAGR